MSKPLSSQRRAASERLWCARLDNGEERCEFGSKSEARRWAREQAKALRAEIRDAYRARPRKVAKQYCLDGVDAEGAPECFESRSAARTALHERTRALRERIQQLARPRIDLWLAAPFIRRRTPAELPPPEVDPSAPSVEDRPEPAAEPPEQDGPSGETPPVGARPSPIDLRLPRWTPSV